MTKASVRQLNPLFFQDDLAAKRKGCMNIYTEKERVRNPVLPSGRLLCVTSAQLDTEAALIVGVVAFLLTAHSALCQPSVLFLVWYQKRMQIRCHKKHLGLHCEPIPDSSDSLLHLVIRC